MAVATSNPYLALAGQDSDDEGSSSQPKPPTTAKTTTTKPIAAASPAATGSRGGLAAQRGARGAGAAARGSPGAGRGGNEGTAFRGRGRGGDFGGRGNDRGGRGGRGRGGPGGDFGGGGWTMTGEDTRVMGEEVGEDGRPIRSKMRFNDRDRRRGVGTTRHRDFDRHVPAQGRGRGEVKKGGGGAHNWGNTAADYGASDAQQQGAATALPEGADPVTGSGELPAPAGGANTWESLTGDTGDAPAADGENGEEKTRKVEAVTMYYDQWLELQNAKRANLPALPSAKRAVDKTDLEKDGFEVHVKEVNRVDGLRGSGLQGEAPVGGKTDYYASRRRAGGDALGDQLMNSFGAKSGRGRGRGRGGFNNSAAPVAGGGEGDDAAIEQPTFNPPSRKGPRGTPPNLGDETAFPSL